MTPGAGRRGADRCRSRWSPSATPPGTAAGMKVCPGADPTDGLFDVTVVGPMSRLELVRHPAAADRRHARRATPRSPCTGPRGWSSPRPASPPTPTASRWPRCPPSPSACPARCGRRHRPGLTPIGSDRRRRTAERRSVGGPAPNVGACPAPLSGTRLPGGGPPIPRWRTSPPSWASPSTRSRSRRARRSTRARASWSARPPAPARPSWASSPIHKALAEGRKAFYTTPIKALSNQKYADLVERYGAGQGRPADRRQRRQRRRARGRDDHRGAAQHALRRLPGDRRARLRGHGRGALPRRPVPRRGLGGGDHPPPAVGHPGLAVGDGQQRRGVRRLAGHRPRRTRRSSSARCARSRCGSTCWSATGCSTCSRCARPRTPASTASTPRALSTRERGASVVDPELVRYVREHERRIDSWHGGGPAASRRATTRTGRATGRRRAPTSSPGWTTPGCCRRSPSSSAATAATPPSTSACWPGCG